MSLVSLLTVIICCLLACYGALIGFYHRAWQGIPAFDASGKTARTRITVVIPARNEEANIRGCLESLALQSYPMDLFQVIVIDDHSTDATREIVSGYHPAEMFLLYASLAEHGGPGQAYKKFAIEVGVSMAFGELIVTTDADCRFSAGWLQTLAAFYEDKGAAFIAAPVRMGLPNTPYPLFAAFQILDFITLQGITGAAVAKKFHSMCNGANLAYDKNIFAAVGGFRDIDDIPSGDDMLLMHKIYRKYPDRLFFLKSRAAIVSTQPETSWKGFVNQRVRWASKAGRYDDRRIYRVLLLVYVLNVALLILPVAACFDRWWLWVLLFGLLTKTVMEYPFVNAVAEFFGQRGLTKWFAVLQPFHIVYTVVIGWMGQFGSYRWKDRTIKK
jgi:glycosyltransferase involved in cell wall biosynthesis